MGFPLANASASFYAARLTPAAGNGTGYDILQVMGPDEFAYPVDNSAYTNAVAAIALRFAVEAAGVIGAVLLLLAEQVDLQLVGVLREGKRGGGAQQERENEALHEVFSMTSEAWSQIGWRMIGLPKRRGNAEGS